MPRPVRRRLASCAVLAAALASAAAPARGEDYFGAAAEPMTFDVDRPRSRENMILIGSLLGGAVVFGGVGLLFHLHSRNQADEVSADTGDHTGLVYTEAVDATRRDAERSGKLAIGGYAVGGGFLIATLVVYIVTDPGTETIQVGDETEQPPAPTGRPQVLVEPTPGGGVVGAAWTW